MSDEFYPVLCWGFAKVGGVERLHQMWVSADGKVDYRPVPMIEMKADRPRSVAGWVSEEDEDA